MCDPLEEICPEQYGEHAIEQQLRETGFKYSYEMEPYSLLWLASSLGVTAHALYIWNAYYNHFAEDLYTWPIIPLMTGDDNFGQYWVQNTPELKTW